MLELANAERIAQEAIAAALKPPAKVDYLEWAKVNIVFTKRESPEPGPYNPDRFSYFGEVLRALSPADPCRIVTLAKSAQLGGTVLANVFTGGSLDMDPGDLLYVHPTENNAERWSKMKLSPMLKGTASLKAIFPQRSRDGGDSVLYKERSDGLGAILISGANSPASLSQVTVGRQVQDDLSKWEPNSAGDPEVQADSRSRAISFAKIFKISTPLVMPGCRITTSYEAGSQEKLFVPCPHCSHMQTLDWENMLSNLDEARPDYAVFSCVECGCDIEEHHRSRMLAGAEWRAANPKMLRQHRSFYIWSAYSFLQSWKQIAFEWFKAKGDPAKEQAFLNDTVGQAYKAQGESPPWEGLRDRAERDGHRRGTVPDWALLVTMGLDCQDNRVEWQVVGFGRNSRRAIVDHGVVPGHIGEPATRDMLDALVDQTWPDQAKRRVPIKLSGIDGNYHTEDVWGWARRHPPSRVIMVRGVGRETAPLLERVRKELDNLGRALRYSSRFYNFATSTLKMSLYRNLAKTDPEEPGYVAIPSGLDEEFYRQLTSERRVAVKKFGFTAWRWKKDDGQANEALDTHLQAETAANKLGLRGMPDATWDALAGERERLPTSVPVAENATTDEKPSTPAETAANPASSSDSWFGARTQSWMRR